MVMSQKCQYALRAVFELAKHTESGPLKIGKIAEVQDIPVRFLENILSQLKRSGLVASRRGNEGGYLLTRPPREISLGDVIRFVEGPIKVVECSGTQGSMHCKLEKDCILRPVWEEAREALKKIYDNTSFQDLLEKQQKNSQEVPGSFSI
jgi:Rrf2 family protein